MTRSEHIDQLSSAVPGLGAEDYTRFLTAFFRAIGDQMVADGRVEIRGFGTFITKQRRARESHDPRSGAAIDVPAKRVMAFRVSKKLEARINRAAALPLGRAAARE